MRMRMSGTLVVLGVLGGLLACANDDEAADTTAASTTVVSTTAVPTSTTTPSATIPADLNRFALTLDDVGATWKPSNPLNDADFRDFGGLPCEDMAINPTILERIRPTAGVQFEPSTAGSRHLIEFILSGESARLAADIDVLIGAEQACADQTRAGSESLKVERLTIPDLGEQRAAFLLRGLESEGGTAYWYVRQGIVRVGGIAITIGLTEILSSPTAAPTIPDTEFVRLLTAATARITP